jgi:hypothetical protein
MTKRLRNENFPIPQKISDADFETLCETFYVASNHRQRLRMRLDGFLDALARSMSIDRALPDRKSDQEHLEEILAHIRAAAAQTNKLGPAGHLALRTISPFVSLMLAAQWMNESFPDNDYTPKRSVPKEFSGLRSPRQTYRTSTYFIEEDTQGARFEFVRQNPAITLNTALKQFGEGLSEALRTFDLQPSSKGGQKPLLYRHYALIHLIGMWDEMGREPSSGPRSGCTAFCEAVVDAMKWPTQGLSAAMPDAIKHWRHLSGKTNS